MPPAWRVPAEVRCLFHIMPTFCPSVCASVTAMAATLPYCMGGTAGSRGGTPRPAHPPAFLTHLVDPPAAAGRADAPHEGGAAAAALKRPSPARVREEVMGKAAAGSQPWGRRRGHGAHEKRWTVSLCSGIASRRYFMNSFSVSSESSSMRIRSSEAQVSMATSTMRVLSCSL